MTMFTIILINVALGALAVYGLVSLLVSGIRTDRRMPAAVRRMETRRREPTRLAA